MASTIQSETERARQAWMQSQRDANGNVPKFFNIVAYAQWRRDEAVRERQLKREESLRDEARIDAVRAKYAEAEKAATEAARIAEEAEALARREADPLYRIEQEVERVRLDRQERKAAAKAARDQVYGDGPVLRILADKLRDSARHSFRYHTDPEFKLRIALRCRLWQALRAQLAGASKSGSAVRDLGCSVAELKIYLEQKFTPGMSWENWALDGWHVDHIRPLASFNLLDPAQVKLACHFTNLQPLWAADNLSKSARWIGVV